MTTLEQLLQGKTNIISRNRDIRLVESEPRFKEKNGLSNQKKHKKKLIKINSRKFPEGFFQINQISNINRKLTLTRELKRQQFKVGLISEKSISLDKQTNSKHQDEFQRTSFFKYSQDILNRNDQKIVQKSQSKKSTNERGKWTADTTRELQQKKYKPKTKEDDLFACTFFKNLSKQLSTDAQSPISDNDNQFRFVDKISQKRYFRIPNIDTLEFTQHSVLMTQRNDRSQMKIRRKHSISKPLQLPYIFTK